MAKKRKHLKTDRRSVERRKAQAELRAKAVQQEKMRLSAKYGFNLAAKAEAEGNFYNPSLKDLKREERKAKEEREKRETRAKESQEAKQTGKAKAEPKISRKSTENIAEKRAKVNAHNEAKKEQWIKRRQKERNLEFAKWRYANPIRNPNAYTWFEWSDIPYMNPQNYKERERDKKLWKELQESLNNPNEEEARAGVIAVEEKILKTLKKTGGFETGAKNEEISFRGATIENKNTDMLNYLNYLEAAKDRGLNILADAIEAGGVDFVHWLYYTVKFDWRDFYKDEDYEIGFDQADRTFLSLCRTYANDVQYGEIFRNAMTRYAAETPYM